MAKKTKTKPETKKIPADKPKKTRNAVCSECSKPGHNARTCGRK